MLIRNMLSMIVLALLLSACASDNEPATMNIISSKKAPPAAGAQQVTVTGAQTPPQVGPEQAPSIVGQPSASQSTAPMPAEQAMNPQGAARPVIHYGQLSAANAQQSQDKSGQSSAVVKDKAISNSSIILHQPVAKAWGQVHSALNKAGFAIMQQDKSLNSYFVADKAATGGKFAPNTPVLKIQLSAEGQKTRISLRESSGASAKSQTVHRLYNALP